MNVQAWTFVMVGLSFALYIGIAVWSRATSTEEFYVAGGAVSPLANGLATAADWMSAASFRLRMTSSVGNRSDRDIGRLVCAVTVPCTSGSMT